MLLYGPPGTGKTMLAKAVANHTTAAFIRVVGSEFVQKYLGEVSYTDKDVITFKSFYFLCFLNYTCLLYIAFSTSLIWIAND